VEKIIDEIDKMYNEAGLEMTVFHIGGDEVARGAWEGSAVCRQLMQEKGVTQLRELKDYFLEQVLPMLSKRKIQPAGWDDFTTLPNNQANPKFKNSNILSYCWNTVPTWGGDQVPYELANEGYPIILGNVTNFYLDMSYSKHPAEPGLHWGGFVNEYNSFDMLPYDIYKSLRCDMSGNPVDINTVSKGKIALKPGAAKQIKGVQGQIWAETIRSFEQVEYYMFPKMFGLVDRAWNMQPAWSNPYNEQAYEAAKGLYNAKIAAYELPRLAKEGVNFRISQPGIILKDGMLYMNTALVGANNYSPLPVEIRYTLDGSEPTATSVLWTAPVPCDAKQVKAKVFYLGKHSVTTIEPVLD
jgi:hexosaminidase